MIDDERRETVCVRNGNGTTVPNQNSSNTTRSGRIYIATCGPSIFFNLYYIYIKIYIYNYKDFLLIFNSYIYGHICIYSMLNFVFLSKCIIHMHSDKLTNVMAYTNYYGYNNKPSKILRWIFIPHLLTCNDRILEQFRKQIIILYILP